MTTESPRFLPWVAAARTGDRAAWNALHAHFAPGVHAVALAHGPHATADDVVQETFARAMEKLPTLREDAAFGGWLHAIARNLATSAVRRRRRFTLLPERLFAPARPTAEANEALEAIRGLPEAYSELLMMRLVEGLTGPEIAEQLGRTQGSVRVTLHRGMKLLREALGEAP
ncbi:MAG: sigma-70 family RNA polymerase sigma factor [Alphaproteobacteria bacterium]|nr:sigma-70 family RNA polymerase sigma factor [Alphaproteobacteria bacterium]